ncbi:MAG: 1,3-beta-galactosyl-N-acetylhexosamine phosphorylase C-terminal domain-containing protein, partial [Acetivibrio ethanolgignens]
PYSFVNNRLFFRAVLWASHSEEKLKTWYSENYNVEVHAYPENGKYCVVNNTYEPQKTTVYTINGESYPLEMEANEIRWYSC